MLEREHLFVEDDSFFGDDVNIAARLENFAEAGEVCLSGAVFDRVKETSDWGFDSFGEERFKNIAHPVRVYRVRTDPEAIGQVIPAKRRRPKPGRIWRAAAAASLIALLGATGWGVKVQVEKRRAEAEAASVIADSQISVATAEAQIVRLLENLRESEKRATDEQERAESLLAALREAEDQVMAAREAAEQERQARQEAERPVADRTLMESLLASWRAAEREAANFRSWLGTVLTAPDKPRPVFPQNRTSR